MNNSMSMILIMALGVLVFLLFILFITLFFVNRKEKKNKKVQETENNVGNVEGQDKQYSKQSIFKFMNFDKVDDNMIIQNKGKRYLMVIECKGINYDLMSGLEKNSVEQGFLQFLNTLRYTIQIYVQTRTVNLTSSIDSYRERVKNIETELSEKQSTYNEKVRSGNFNKIELDRERFDIIRLRHLYEYGVDIINNTERMSLNKNILSKYYYIIIPYYPEDLGNNDFDKSEISNIAFSELYTKCQTIINSLGVCGVKGKILDSTELMELLYTAYNRDQAEALSLQRALGAGYDELYSTAPDVLDKRMEELDKKIEREAIEKANDAIYKAIEENEKQSQVQNKEDELDKLINEMAKNLIAENEQSIGEDVAQEAIREIDRQTEEKEEKKNVKEKTTTKTTRRTRQSKTA